VIKRPAQPPTVIVCAQCGKVFEVTKHRDKIFCSHRCGNRAAIHVRNHMIRTHPIPAERFTLLEIAMRDGWSCHLCGEDVTQGNWSMDHLIPVSKGGPHTKANVKLAHRRCNSRRKNKDLGEALWEVPGITAAPTEGPENSC
jgi:5-methylcytosine-specific restriction endonuclease McrA